MLIFNSKSFYSANSNRNDISVIGMEVGPSYGDPFQSNSVGIDGRGTA